MIKEILDINDIKLLVDTFYDNIRKDELLGPIFNEKLQNRWPEHLEKMYRFWQTVLLNEHTYSGSPFAPHARLEVEKKHFDHWIHIFYGTIDALFKGKKAEEAKWRGNKMAEMFNYKIEYYRNSNIH